jgi:ribosomal protein S18 acetylase RimI-like enzyme
MDRTSRGASSDESALFVAQAGGELVGLASIVLLEGRWHLFAMWVDPALRGRGIGGRILDASLRWLETQAPDADLWLEVNPRQQSAERLYQSRGFTRTGQRSRLDHTPAEELVTMVRRPLPPRSAPGVRGPGSR